MTEVGAEASSAPPSPSRHDPGSRRDARSRPAATPPTRLQRRAWSRPSANYGPNSGTRTQRKSGKVSAQRKELRDPHPAQITDRACRRERAYSCTMRCLLVECPSRSARHQVQTPEGLSEADHALASPKTSMRLRRHGMLDLGGFEPDLGSRVESCAMGATAKPRAYRQASSSHTGPHNNS